MHGECCVSKIRRVHICTVPLNACKWNTTRVKRKALRPTQTVVFQCTAAVLCGTVLFPNFFPPRFVRCFSFPNSRASQLATPGIFLRFVPRQMHDRPAPTARRFTARCRGFVAAGRRTAAVQRRPTATASAATAERRPTASKPVFTPAASNAVNAIPDSFVASVIALSNCAAFRAVRDEARPSFRPARYGAAA